MNTKTIETALKKQALKLKKGDNTQKNVGVEIIALAEKLELYRKRNEKPVDAENAKAISIGPPGPFQPRPWPGRK
jgi:hypothetical protein